MRHLVSLGVVAVLLGGPALAQPSLPMTSAATNRVNATDIDPDERFFTVKGAPSNIFFIIDSSGSMMDFVVNSNNLSRPSEGHCNDPTYNAALPTGFVATGNYPPPDVGLEPGNADVGYPDLFRQNVYYRRSGNGALDGLSKSGVNSGDTYSTAAKACELVKNNQRAACATCMDTKGYFLGQDSSNRNREVFRGQFLNVYPPKFVTARAVLKKVIWESTNVRMGLAQFDGSDGAKKLRGFSPSCDQLTNEKSEEWIEGKRAMLRAIGDKDKSGITFSGNTPLAEALFDVGQFFTTDAQYLSWFGNTNHRKSAFTSPALNDPNRSVCLGCQVNAVVLISDGAPTSDGNIPQKIKDQKIGCTGNACNDSGSYLDDVANWFNKNDLIPDDAATSGWSPKQPQVLRTYTIGFGIDLPLMQSAAFHGGGEYQTANDGTSLAGAITDAIESVKMRAMAFGSTSVATLQTSAEGASLIPRFVPEKEGEPWKGYLYRFKLVNESLSGCVPASGGSPAVGDLDGDGKCMSLAYVDRDGDPVQEDPISGDFIKRSSGQLARPVWEAGKMLTYGNMNAAVGSAPPSGVSNDRKIWTVVDSDSNGKLDASDPLIEFSVANADKLMGPMGLKADVRSDDVCRSIYARMGLGGDVETVLKTWGKRCAEILISYYRGVDAANPNPSFRGNTRGWLLADIFHSSPVVVEPPMLPESCAYFPGQCLASIWATNGNFNHPNSREAYESYVTGNGCGVDNCEERRTIALVGSNGGFLHAFDMGGVQGTPERDLLTGRLAYEDLGTGKELWAFAPPDILGVLKYGLDRHTFMVDGTAMVRDVWVDGSNGSGANQTKETSEFRTMAVVGTGGGGRHFFALDVTKDAQLTRAPAFRWMWPQPNDKRTADMGDSFSNFYPRPPPIGPVLLESANGFDFTYKEPNAAGSGFEEKPTVKAAERWIVGLNGGLDRSLQRGRGFALVDVWTGQTVWDFFWEPNLSATDPRNALDRPVAAGLAMLDMGAGELTAETPFDGYFDAFTVGDLGGNVWVGRMHAPGKVGPDGKVTNWHAARGFQSAKATPADRRPISFLTSNALQKNTGYLRTFFGTGDRSALLENSPGVCSLGNLAGCIEMGCNVQLTEWHSQLPTGMLTRTSDWASANPTLGSVAATSCASAKCVEPKIAACAQHCTATSCASGAGTSAAGMRACIAQAYANPSCAATCDDSGVAASGLASLVTVTGCPTSRTDAQPNHAPIVRAVYSRCGIETNRTFVPAADGSDTVTEVLSDVWACRSSTYRNDSGVNFRYKNNGTNVRHGFAGVHLYGGRPDRTFGNATSAQAFDGSRYTESQLVNLGSLSSPSNVQGTSDGRGWHLTYDHGGERTASPAGMTASLTGESMCVVWNSLSATRVPEVCSGQGAQEARLIQADFVTGSSLCLEQFLDGQRFLARSVLSPPPEPARATIISASGVSSGLVTTEPGQPPTFYSGFTNSDPLQPVYQLELTSQEHQCRHDGVAAACGI